jgi:transcriptional regulator with XRE-family HTH domain
MLKEEIGDRLRDLRVSKNYSLRALAEKLNVSYSTLYKIENGDNYPSIEILDKLSKHFDVERSYFFGESKDVPDKFKDKIKWIAFGDKMEQFNLSPEQLEEMLEGFLKIYGDKDK